MPQVDKFTPPVPNKVQSYYLYVAFVFFLAAKNPGPLRSQDWMNPGIGLGMLIVFL